MPENPEKKGQIIFMTYHYENLKNEFDNERERFLGRLKHRRWTTFYVLRSLWRTDPRDLKEGLGDLELDKTRG